MDYLRFFFSYISRLKPIYRRLCFVIHDILIILISLYFSLYISYLNVNPINKKFSQIVIFSLISIIIYTFTGAYKGLTKYLNSSELYKIAVRNLLILILLYFINLRTNIPFSINSYIIFWFFITGFIGANRFILRDLLIRMKITIEIKKPKIIIYGAGSAGAQLTSSLRISGKYLIKAFIDDAEELQGRTLYGVKIFSKNFLKKNILSIDKIFLAIPSLSNSEKKKIILNLSKYSIPILSIPSLEELESKKSKIDALRPINIKDLLSRDSINPNKDLLVNSVKNKVICITGAAGSIGSEICRQMLNLSPRKIIIIDQNEEGLYTLNEEFKRENINNKIEIKYFLGNILKFLFIKKIFNDECVDIVFHSAAYKHVPIVENNIISGLYNNIFSSLVICRASQETAIKRITLISTDKAVRPTNIMGASKRISELIFQAYNDLENNKDSIKKRYSIVRFGNVLGSSGSVVHCFNKQIISGGPITITHKKMMRYFMSVQEAAQLVIQSSLMSKGGEVFLLDMGEPIYIQKLAEQMINLSGNTLKNKENPDGNIEIIYTGLRPGEKLSEELLIDGESQETEHPLIYKANEYFIPSVKLFPLLTTLKTSLKKHNEEVSLEIIKTLVPEWKKVY